MTEISAYHNQPTYLDTSPHESGVAALLRSPVATPICVGPVEGRLPHLRRFHFQRAVPGSESVILTSCLRVFPGHHSVHMRRIYSLLHFAFGRNCSVRLALSDSGRLGQRIVSTASRLMISNSSQYICPLKQFTHLHVVRHSSVVPYSRPSQIRPSPQQL